MICLPSAAVRNGSRRGAAAVELSVCLPLFLLVIAGSLETCNLIYLRESMCVAAYEAARIAAKESGNRDEAVKQGQQILDSRGIRNADIKIEPQDLESWPPGTMLEVTISTPVHAQSMLPKAFLGDHEIASRTVLVKE